jgi:recombination associated protein RdgC
MKDAAKMWFKNLIVYRVPARWDMPADTLEGKLRAHAFAPVGGIDETSIGWVAPIDGDPSLVHSIAGQMLVTLRQERKLLPSKVVAQFVKQRAEKIEEDEGFRPGRRRLKELRESVRDELLPRAFSLATDTRVWFDPAGGWMVVDAGSASKADEVFGLLARAIDGFPGRSLKVARLPSAAMTAWLETAEAPSGFSIDQDVELKARDGNATVRYANQSLEHDDVVRHTRAGKSCTKLALTWNDRVSFLLTDRLEIKRVRPLDVLREASRPVDAGTDARERLDSDMTLMTGELSRMLDDVVDALGGQVQAQAA